MVTIFNDWQDMWCHEVVWNGQNRQGKNLALGIYFAHQAQAQLRVIQQAKPAGEQITPVWNKSFREHEIIGSSSMMARQAADNAVQALGWTDP